MIPSQFATQFAAHWIEAWNSHDLEQVLQHYADDFEMSSPYITRIAGEPSGVLKGKAAVGAYWAKALERMPDLRFELVEALSGIDSIVILYRNNNRAAAEVLMFDSRGRVAKAYANYTLAL